MHPDPDACYRAICARDARCDGRFYTAVLSTGIYCRPTCQARTPLRRNVRFYLFAAAAQQAGFRPCLRCRPHAAPDLGVRQLQAGAVARALALIELGALQQDGVGALARRLGLGERELRRRFHEQVGAAPRTVERTRRMMHALQLLEQTGLPAAEIARAAGLPDARRLDARLRGHGAPAAGAQRRARGAVVSIARGDEIELRLPYAAPYDWPSILDFLRRRAITGVEAVGADSYARTFEIDGMPGTLDVRPGPGDALLARIRVADAATLPQVVARLRRVFDLAIDPLHVGRHLARDATLAPLVARRPGLRLPGAWDGFELAIRAVLGQQITVAAAAQLAARLVVRHGEPLDPPVRELTHRFPRPAALEGADLGTLGLPRSRAATLVAVAAAVRERPRLLDPDCGLDEAVLRLRAVRGIGEWTAQYIAMRQLRECDAFPAADVALQRALTDGAGRRPTERELLERANPWRPWRAYAAQHLWTALAD